MCCWIGAGLIRTAVGLAWCCLYLILFGLMLCRFVALYANALGCVGFDWNLRNCAWFGLG